MKPTNYFNEEYNYKPDTDEPEMVECVLCNEDVEIELSNKIAGHHVCSECIKWHNENEESVFESIIIWKRQRDAKRQKIQRDLEAINIPELQRNIKMNCKP